MPGSRRKEEQLTVTQLFTLMKLVDTKEITKHAIAERFGISPKMVSEYYRRAKTQLEIYASS